MPPVKTKYGIVKQPVRFDLGERVVCGNLFGTVVRRFGFDVEGRQIVRVVREDGEIIQGNAQKLPGASR